MNHLTIITILLMALTTYLTRIVGYLFLRKREFSSRVKYIIETAPGCVLITVIAPHFTMFNPANILPLIISVIVSVRFPLLPAVILTVAITAALRFYL